jgi:DNA-binding transcriptional ArsR family regulator
MSPISDMSVTDQDRIWKALADPTRRRVLELLADEPVTTGDIAARFSPNLGRTTVMKHLDVLEIAGLIRIERTSRIRRNHLIQEPLDRVSNWLDRRVMNHRGNLQQLRRLSESVSPAIPKKKSGTKKNKTNE